MAEWLYEDGIGEARAALVEDDRIVEARIDIDDGGLRIGAVLAARLVEQRAGRQGLVVAADARELLLTHVPPGTTQGAWLTVVVTREVIPEGPRTKLARCAATDAAAGPAPTLRASIAATGMPVRECLAHQPDALEAAGWSELLAEATSGDIACAGGMLRMTPTPAMTLFDVDGSTPPDTLALAAAQAVCAAIRRHGIGGSIGIDFPTLAGKAPRLAVAAAIDAGLAPPFERTAVNGFGFLQIVRPRLRASIPELLRADPVAAAARAALRSIARTPPGNPAPHRLPRAVHDHIVARPDWLADLARRTGARPRLESA